MVVILTKKIVDVLTAIFAVAVLYFIFFR